MVFQYRRLILVKKYLLISLLLSIIPLLVSAFLYDRYTASLLDNILIERLESDVEGSAEKIQKFLNTHADRLNNLADIPEIESVFVDDRQLALSEKLLDFIYLEVGSSDVYGAVFLDVNDRVIRSVPENVHTQLIMSNVVNFGYVDIVQPVFPRGGRPGWFGMKRDVFKGGQRLGAIVLKLRLASLTEHTASLYRKDFYEPQIHVNDSALSVLGIRVEEGDALTSAWDIIPGWQVLLVKSKNNIEQPRVRIRYLLLCIVALACVAIIFVFVHMSEKLASLLLPLTEGARSIAKGDFSVRVSEQVPGELKELAHSFNQMSEQLVAMIDSRVDTERRGALGNLAAGIAHEIRNPLTTLRTSIHALSFDERNAEKQEMFALITEEIIRIDGMVEEFLSYARPHEPSIEDVLVKEWLHSIEGLTSATLADANIQTTYLGDQSLILRVDPAQLRQVFMNLILNAVHAMPNGGQLTIRVERMVNAQQEPQAMMTLTDNGEGMSASVLDKVQMPFFTTKAAGTGLGLSICSQLLRRNNGSMMIESTLGKGTSIILILPSKGGVAAHA